MKAYVTTALAGAATQIERTDGILAVHAPAEGDGVVVNVEVPGKGTLVITALTAAGLATMTYAATMRPYTGVGGDVISGVGNTGAASAVTGTIGVVTA